MPWRWWLWLGGDLTRVLSLLPKGTLSQRFFVVKRVNANEEAVLILAKSTRDFVSEDAAGV